MGALGVLILATIWMFRSTPTSFIPTEDDSFLTYSIAMPPGSSLHRTTESLHLADSIIQAHPAVRSVNSVSGFNVLDNATSPSFAMGYINLFSAKERGEIRDIESLTSDLLERLEIVQDADIAIFSRPTVQGFGEFSGLQLVLQDRIGEEFSTFSEVSDHFIAGLNTLPEIEQAFTSFNANFPQFEIEIDYVKAKNMGVSVQNMLRTIQSYYGRVQSGDFNRFGRQCRVYMQADVQYRDEINTIDAIFVKDASGEMVPVNTLVTAKKTRFCKMGTFFPPIITLT